jgi:glyoxylase-like metal-dependent hydrolase (beta-lactamase superfamily II)
MFRALFAIAALAAAGTAALAQPPAAPPAAGPMVKAGATKKLTDHVWAIPDDSVGGVPNIGFIVGSTGALVIDTGMGAENGRTVLAEARKLAGNKKLYLVTTHVHPEHDLGAQAFPATTVLIRSNAQVAEIAEEGMRTADAFRGRSAVNARLLEGAVFRKADVTFDKAYDLDLGGVKVKLSAIGPNHTQGDTAIWVEGDKVLFSGDVAMKGMPAFASSKSSLSHWLTSLDGFDKLAPKIIVPSHGPNGDASYIAGYRKYLTLIRDKAAAAKKDAKTADQTVELVTADLKSAGFDTGRATPAIRAAYVEAK